MAVRSCLVPLSGVVQSGRVSTGVAPKVTGTWNLRQAMTRETLDFFMAFGPTGGGLRKFWAS
ncbi:hypothetical protein BO99DRAFT_398982 [Aspergillus violaceofuscus CBS 115571]|uniref:Ketoreductase (KR) domain-containing protein n=1 Tax=Aspergillus violaceofuscus (strain CBS 115571) TaxID=1450538 RepID=A0A2V5HMZ0_ASPV1|nr:hypothetical protein BO99DRAFT_398982 [Aspergillus violaceofuscus CBS 115571]